MQDLHEQSLRRKFKSVRVGRNGKTGAKEYMLKCPKCRKQYKLYANPERNMFHCFKCEYSGTFAELLGVGAFAFAGSRAQLAPPEKPREQTADDLSPGQIVSLDQLPPAHPAVEYLTKTRERPFDPVELGAVYGVRYCVAGKLYLGGSFDTTDTLVFPVHMAGKLVGWQARLMYDPDELSEVECAMRGFPLDDDGARVRPPKYMTGPGFKKSEALFNFDQAVNFPHVVVCEGVFDAMSVGPCAVATLGKTMSQRQIKLLKSYWDVVVLMLDDDVRDEEVAGITSQISSDVTTIPVRLIGYKDPGSAPRSDIWEQMFEAMRQRKLDVSEALELMTRTRARATPPAVDPMQARPPLRFVDFRKEC
jgi:hypothetical protein